MFHLVRAYIDDPAQGEVLAFYIFTSLDVAKSSIDYIGDFWCNEESYPKVRTYIYPETFTSLDNACKYAVEAEDAGWPDVYCHYAFLPFDARSASFV